MADTSIAASGLEEIEIQGMSRSAFIMRGALAASAVYGTAAVGPFVGEALAAGGGGDVGILNFALTLEYLESAFYKEAQAKVKLSSKTAALAKLIGNDENMHVQALTQAIKGAGGKPVKAPGVKFPFSDEKGFLKLATTFEDTGVSAYNGAAPAIKSKAILGAAGSIVQIEARHAAAIRLMAGLPPAPNAFDPKLEKGQVLKAVKPFLA
jgi:Ferritin-like domain